MKLFINENAISDLRKIAGEGDFDAVPDEMTGDYQAEYGYGDGRRGHRGKFRPGGWRGTAPKMKDALINWFSKILTDNFDINANDANLERVETPRTADSAKKSPDILIGVSSRTGDAMVIGQGQFWGMYRGHMGAYNKYDNYSKFVQDPEPDYRMNHPRVSYREQFQRMDKWYKVVLPASDDYMSRSAVRKANNRGGDNRMVEPDDFSYRRGDPAYKYFPKSRRIFQDEIALYNPEYAQDALERRLRDRKALSRFRDAMATLEETNDRIRSIDFGNPIFGGSKFSEQDISRLRSAYNSYTHYIQRMQECVAEDGMYDNYLLGYANDYYAKVNTMLTDIFGV